MFKSKALGQTVVRKHNWIICLNGFSSGRLNASRKLSTYTPALSKSSAMTAYTT